MLFYFFSTAQLDAQGKYKEVDLYPRTRCTCRAMEWLSTGTEGAKAMGFERVAISQDL